MDIPLTAASRERPTPLTRAQIVGFWGAWAGWTLDGMDSVIYALVLAPALTELLPKSGIAPTPGHVGLVGSILFALFLVGWGLSSLWGPLADRLGRARVLAMTVLVYAVFTGVAALSQNVYELAAFRLLAGFGIGGEWSLAGTYVAEAWPEDRRKSGAGYLQTGYYVGFFLAAALNGTVGAHLGWRAMFLCGLSPVIAAFAVRRFVQEPERWRAARDPAVGPTRDRTVAAASLAPLRAIFAPSCRRRTIVNAALLTVAILGLWSGTVYEPTAIMTLAKRVGVAPPQAIRLASYGTGLLSIGTILGCLALPPLAERFGRRPVLAAYFLGMGVTIAVSFGVVFYLPAGLHAFIAMLFVLGFFGGNFTMFSLWLPEQYETPVRATAFAFATSAGRFIAAAGNFALGALIARWGTLGAPVACTALAFLAGIAIIPLSVETRGRPLPP
ncbi:MAG TPA: MFS transporter [Polyangiaceae bacterium]|nr:MFS transporter [Polyangiaceae bacterium]